MWLSLSADFWPISALPPRPFILGKKENSVMEQNLIVWILLVIAVSLVAFFTREKTQKKEKS
jgi:hypothetical protein